MLLFLFVLFVLAVIISAVSEDGYGSVVGLLG